jgi:phosphoribosylglycinamide formyltransferase 1
LSSDKRIVVLISGRGSNLAAILRQQQAGTLGGQVVAVLSNRADAAGLQHAAQHGVPAEVLEHRGFGGRAAFDTALAERIEAYRPDLVVLAGFMRILSRGFVERFRGRLVNTHPSLLPAFPGLHAVAQALAAGVTETGCSVHFVSEQVDGGPVIAQRRVPVLQGDTVESLEARVLAQEHELLPETIRRILAGEVASGPRALPG